MPSNLFGGRGTGAAVRSSAASAIAALFRFWTSASAFFRTTGALSLPILSASFLSWAPAFPANARSRAAAIARFIDRPLLSTPLGQPTGLERFYGFYYSPFSLSPEDECAPSPAARP